MPNITFGRWNPTEVLERRLDNDWPSPTPYATNLVTPTSVAKTGTGSTATINTNGSVTFSSCETLSLNGVFSADYDNYMVVMRSKHTSTSLALKGRLRVGGSDNATSSSYVEQSLYATSTTVGGSRTTSDSASIFSSSNTIESGDVAFFYGPYLAQPTAFRNNGAYGYLSATVQDFAWTHNQSVSYDGFTIIVVQTNPGTIAGLVSVYGLGV